MATPSNVTVALNQGVEFNDRAVFLSSEPLTLEANAIYTEQLELAISATDTSLDLSTKLDTCMMIIIREVGSNTTGALYGPAAGAGNKFALGGGKGTVLRLKDDSTPPTLYFSNPSSTLKLFIEVTAIGSRS